MARTLSLPQRWQTSDLADDLRRLRLPSRSEITHRVRNLRRPTRADLHPLALVDRFGVHLFFLMVAATPAVPHMALAGPLSLDDVMPGFATLVGLLLVWRGHRRLRPTLHGWLLVGVAIVSAIASLVLGVYPTLLAGSVRWLQMAFIVALAFTLIRTRREARFFLSAVAGVALFEAGFGLVAEALGISAWNGYIGIEKFRGYESIAKAFPGRITGTLGMAATFVAAFLAASTPVCVGLALDRKGLRSLFWWAVSGVVALGVFFTFSRISLVAAAGFAFGVLILRAPWKVWVPIIVVTVAGVWFSPMRTRFASDGNDRLQLWATALTMIRDHPWVGVGAGRYAHFLPFYAHTAYGTAGATPHNSVLLAWAEQGLLAGALLALAILVGFRTLIPAILRRDALAIGAVFGWAAFVFCAMFANLFFIPQVALTLWALPAAAYAAIHSADDVSPPREDALQAGAASTDGA